MNYLSYALILWAYLFTSSPTQALPLVSESEGFHATKTVTIYPDHKDPQKFYYFPNSARYVFSQEGLPLFNFTYWGLNPPSQDAGAYLVFTMKLHVDREQENALQSFLKNHPSARLATLPVKSSYITLSSQKGKMPLRTLFKELVFPPVSGRAEDELGVSGILTPIGARIFRSKLLKAPDGAFQVNYCYSVSGLGPNMDAVIKVNMKRVYNFFKGSASAGELWWRVSITRVVEELKSQKDILVTINGGNASDKEYIEAITARVIKRLFKPELHGHPEGLPPGAGGGWFTLKAVSSTKRELKNETWTLKRRDLVQRDFCLPLTLRDIDRYKKIIVTNADKQPSTLNKKGERK
ncbi:MAG: hypothetical protein D6797_06755 [Bdellovibrio sp.]|nr:MAG: hypothetical protein D6797_06755 [Bdellovibrio sp.]